MTMAADTQTRIEQHLLRAAFAVGCHWEHIGTTIGLMYHPRLTGDWFNYLRPLEVAADPSTWDADIQAAIARMTAHGRDLVIVVDPQRTPDSTLAALHQAGLALAAKEIFMVIDQPSPSSPATSSGITIRPIGATDDLDRYAQLWDFAFGGTADPSDMAELQATFRASLAAGDTRFFLALLEGHPVGTGALKVREGVAEIIGIATLPRARRRGVASAMVCHLVTRAHMSRATLTFLTVLAGSPAQALYRHLGFREVGEHHLWRIRVEKRYW